MTLLLKFFCSPKYVQNASVAPANDTRRWTFFWQLNPQMYCQEKRLTNLTLYSGQMWTKNVQKIKIPLTGFLTILISTKSSFLTTKVLPVICTLLFGGRKIIYILYQNWSKILFKKKSGIIFCAPFWFLMDQGAQVYIKGCCFLFHALWTFQSEDCGLLVLLWVLVKPSWDNLWVSLNLNWPTWRLTPSLHISGAGITTSCFRGKKLSYSSWGNRFWAQYSAIADDVVMRLKIMIITWWSKAMLWVYTMIT